MPTSRRWWLTFARSRSRPHPHGAATRTPFRVSLRVVSSLPRQQPRGRQRKFCPANDNGGGAVSGSWPSSGGMKATALSISKEAFKPTRHSSLARPRHLPRFAIPQPYCFFAHVCFAYDSRSHATPQATANLLIEVQEKAVRAHDRHQHVKHSAPGDIHAIEVAGGNAQAAGLDFFWDGPQIPSFSTPHFLNFSLVHLTHTSVLPPPPNIL